MIYVIKAVDTEFVKIGISNGWRGRLKSMQTGCPFELVLIAEAEWPNREERRIHSRLRRAGLHVRGEWFKREGETNTIIELLRNGSAGLEEWKRISVYSINRRLRKALLHSISVS